MPRLTRHYAHWPAGVPRTLDVPDRNLFDHLACFAHSQPDKTAVEYYGRQISYRELHLSALRLAGYLQQHLEVRRGDRVVLLMQTCPQFAIASYAVHRCDAVVVALSPMSTPAELEYYIRDSGARVVITMQELLPAAQQLLDDGTLVGCVVGAYSELAGSAADVPFLTIPPLVSEPFTVVGQARLHTFHGALTAGIMPTASVAKGDDLAVIAYTSGTTGKPKGAMLSHKAFVHALEARVRWMGVGDDVKGEYNELGVLPLNHLAGMCQMHVVLGSGRTLVWLTRWDAEAALALVDRRRLGGFGGVTPMLMEALAVLERQPHDISSVKRLMVGATAMPDAVANALEQRFGLPLLESYGMTETCAATHINPLHAARRQCAGIPFINVDARVLDLESGEELGPGESGELVTHTPTLFLGYWNMSDATAAAFVEIDGKRFIRTGDIGHYDEDGYFYITDRLKRMINAAGFKIWPAEIESMLHGHPAVKEACIISARDPRRGETVKAFVVLRPGMQGTIAAEALIEWCRTQMAAYKVPRLVEFVEALPRNATGKLQWTEMQARQDALDRQQA
ncbi:AMP-binding protein [Cupriavidus numazuensis]|uniref:Long-chain-fatty-acid--CoA ligase n=1 Tax=Cupriavidus numazuensis TaxID=221992 RepID=A0ABM8TSI4_9BURK|nr:AMP-binding protein [Cupriavidus numazuensis]CAG2159312.1 Long-chain-fatty-acid--CoA ligase [Cupriavidus numazuensis]